MPTSLEQLTALPALDSEWIKALWTEISADLTRSKDEIYAQIRSYPPPIPACDVQFNFLLEERAKIFQELGQAGTLAKASLASPEPLRLIEEFMHTSNYLHSAVKQRIYAVLYSL